MLKKRKKQKEVSLGKIFVALVVIAGAGLGVTYLKDHVNFGSLSLANPAAAMENLAQARQLYDQGQLAQAREALEPIARGKDATAGPQAAILLARLQQDEGKGEEAIALLQEAYGKFTESPDHPRLAVAYARALEQSGKRDEALAVFTAVRDNAPPELRAPALTGLGRDAERKNDLLAARDLYRQALEDAAWDSPEWDEAIDALGRANTDIVFSPAKTPESKVYAVERGDSITSIGNKLNTTQGLLLRANGLSESSVLNLNQQLKYTPKDFRIVIERSKCRLFLLDKDGIFKRYKVGLGKPGHETALGTYKIGNKEKDPIWHKPGAGPIPAGDPGNELGTRWMPLVPDQQGLPPDLGIHGTIRPETVGFYSSNGCARLLPEDIEELYDLVVRATPVEIVETYPGINAAPAVTNAVPAATAAPAATATPAATAVPATDAAPAAAGAADAGAAPQADPAVPGMPVSPSGS